MYKFIPYGEYLDSSYAVTHPQARVNIEKTEVVLSCNTHDDCTCVTHKEALAHIDVNWAKPDDEL